MGDDQNTVIEEQITVEETATEEPADEGKSIEEEYEEYFGENGAAEDADASDEDEDADEADADENTDAEESDGEAAAGLTEEPAAPEIPEEPAEVRRMRRLHGEMLSLAKSRGYKSVEDMIADENGENAADVEARLDSEEMTVEEKAAAYDRLQSKDAEAIKAKRASEREAAGKAIHDRLLAEVKAEYPEAAAFASLSDIPDAERFRSLVVEKGLSAADAYAVVTAKQTRAKAAKAAEPSGKAHLIPGKAKAIGAHAGVPDSVLREARDLFPEATDAQIAKMYARVQ